MGGALIVLGEGLSPSNDEARDWARDALSGTSQGSDESPLARAGNGIGRWIGDRFADIIEAGKTIPGIIAIVIVVALVALIIYTLRFVRRTPRVNESDESRRVLAGDPASAKVLRARAEELLAAGNHNGAVREAMRALTRRSIERALLNDSPALTAHEVSIRLRPPFPDYAQRLAEAADLFDRVVYGHLPATAEQAHRILSLDADLQATRPAESGGTPASSTFVVPR